MLAEVVEVQHPFIEHRQPNLQLMIDPVRSIGNRQLLIEPIQIDHARLTPQQSTQRLMISGRSHHQPMRIRFIVEGGDLEFLVRIIRSPMHPANLLALTGLAATASLPPLGLLLRRHHRYLNSVRPHIHPRGTLGLDPGSRDR